MNSKTLKGRIERVELERSPPPTRPMVIWQRDGESDFDLELRVRAVGAPVAVGPWKCETTDEWIESCRRAGYPAGYLP